MIIKKKSKGEIFDILIDDEDYEKFCKYSWYIRHEPHTRYCSANIYIEKKRRCLGLHRFLMGLENGDKRIINHKDGNGLNNQKSNLEICDNNYNTQSINTKRKFGNIGIRKDRKKKHCAKVIINKKIYEKYFYSREEAEEYLEELKEIAIKETKPFL